MQPFKMAPAFLYHEQRASKLQQGVLSSIAMLDIKAALVLASVLSLHCDVQASGAVIEMPTIEEPQLGATAKQDAETIIRAAFNTTIVYDRLAYMTDTFGPRFSGTPGLESALDWIKEHAQEDGIFFREEHVMIPHWVRGREYANLVSPRRKSMRILGLGGSVGTNGQTIQAKALVVSSFDDLERQKSNLRGKIVVYNEEFVSYDATVEYRLTGAARAEKYGAVAALIRSISPYGMQTPHTGFTIPSGIPAVAITLEDAKMFGRMQARGQDVEIELYMEAHTLPDAPSRNLILEIEGGRWPDEYVVLGGHTDSWDIADGAMDDGGGVFVAWEAVRLIKTSGLRPARTIRAVLWVNEENGSKGGLQYATDYANTLAQTSIALESDVGTFTPSGISFLGSDKAREILQVIGEQLLAGIGSGNVTGVGIGEDISFVCEQGVPCGNLNVLDPRIGDQPNNPCNPFSRPPYPQFNEDDFLTSAYFWYHHTDADTIDKLSPEQLQHGAATLGVWAYSIANLDRLLPR